MGLIDDLLRASSKGGTEKVSTDPKKTSSTVNDDGDATVRNANVAVNHDTGEHDTMFSKTTVDGKTGETHYEEGGHGPGFKK